MNMLEKETNKHAADSIHYILFRFREDCLLHQLAAVRQCATNDLQ